MTRPSVALRHQIPHEVSAYESRNGSPIAIGQTIHVDHHSCPAGNDTRQRLYITRKEAESGGTTYLAYCHNCGMGSALQPISNVRAGTYSTPGAGAPGIVPDLTAEMLDLHLVPPGTTGFPAQAGAFLAPITKGGGGDWDAEDLGVAGIGYDRESRRLILPIYDAMTGESGLFRGEAELIGWQSRRLFGYGPKYLTVDGGDPLETTVHLYDTPPELIVIVEDYLSAIRLAQASCEFMAVPLFRYKTSAERIAKLVKTRLPCLVWLDNDRPEVVTEAEHIMRLYRALGGKATRCDLNIDPKNIPGSPQLLKEEVDMYRPKV